MRAADADRDRVVELLNVAFGEGGLAKDEYDDRLENAGVNLNAVSMTGKGPKSRL